MNSLRTDDIIGAIPRVRHMPKNLLRQKFYDHNQEFNQSRNSLPGSSPYHNLQSKYPYNDNFYPNFPLSQYDPVPFIPATNQILERNQFLNGSSNRYDKTQNKQFFQSKRLSSPKMLKKEALFTNYQQISQLEKMKVNFQEKRNFSPLLQSSQNIKIQNQFQREVTNPQIKIIEKKQQIQLKERNSSRGSQKSSKTNKNLDISSQLIKNQRNQQIISPSFSIQNKKQKPNYFRGLGFNIITNRKFQFDVQTRLDPSFLQRDKLPLHN